MPGCCVPLCTNHCRKGVRMFRFPTSPSRRKRWLAQVKRDCWAPTTTSRVCYAHFEDSSFEQKRQDGLKKLRPDAVPTVFAFRGKYEVKITLRFV
ncbi:peroxynitrite isomerase THAP4-like [Dermacentor silvarum]|uniref:peroxynitrite isomerase THAP4-like n=1 Tax=Dermacentor silvarum TaxID=543639 RepID=UPI002100C972|nr:peroxynitrite isomerase THAP4-like [Dermacentor silvarum]